MVIAGKAFKRKSQALFMVHLCHLAIVLKTNYMFGS